jgi:hypothetical protein
LYVCNNNHWSLQEDCSKNNMICIKPAGNNAYCGKPS